MLDLFCVRLRDSAKSILDELRVFNKNEWVVHHPQLREDPTASDDTSRRSLSFADDSASHMPVRLGLTRSVTFASVDSAKETAPEPVSNPPPLSSDLKFGSTSSASSAASLVSQPEKSSIARLLDERLTASVPHIDKLCLHVQDTSKVLATGDPEIYDATENNGVEAVHLEEIIAEYETKGSEHALKAYLAGKDQNSLFYNGTVNISLIDTPGLHRNSRPPPSLPGRRRLTSSFLSSPRRTTSLLRGGVFVYSQQRKGVSLHRREQSLDQSVKLAEDEARTITYAGVARIKDLGEEHHPVGVERGRRIFMPEAMFSAVRRGKGAGGAKGVLKTRNGNAVIVAGGAHGLGIGLSARPDMQESTFLDLFDVNHQFWVHFGDAHSSNPKSSSETDTNPGALSVVGVGIGALTMVGGQAIGVRGVIKGIVRLSDFFGNETARKWALPVVGAVTIGAVVYVVLELPSSIPRTVGRRIKAAVEAAEDDEKQWEA
ncbi:hypothetical protein B0H12DRAFT_1277910 [Mycena haematopus]|nr:hypothetical protein B0H12DRAFT_1277910 [Mycena haematopus]